jgi:uncharacterized membrane protein YeiH
MESLVFIFDKIGIFAFAFVGVSHGVKKKLDVFGLLIVGCITAVGGGMIRDACLGRIPYALSHGEYLLFAVIASILSIIFYHFHLRIPTLFLLIADTFGLAAFAVSGANVAIGASLSILVVIFFAMLTSAGGGLLREIILNEIPFIFRTEIYATAAGIGAVLLYVLVMMGVGIDIASGIALVTIIAIRFYSLSRNINLPVLR